MPLNLPPTRVVPDTRAVQYDGTNAAYIAGSIQGASVLSSNGSMCEIEIVGFVTFTITVNLNDWVLVLAGVFQLVLTDSHYQACQAEVLSANEAEAAMVAAIAAIEATVSLGVANVPALGASQEEDVVVVLATSMPDDTYSVAPVLSGSGNLLSALTIVSYAIEDETQVTVRVRNNGLISLGGAKVIVLAAA